MGCRFDSLSQLLQTLLEMGRGAIVMRYWANTQIISNSPPWRQLHMLQLTSLELLVMILAKSSWTELRESLGRGPTPPSISFCTNEGQR
jgi:hypothetical protein